MVDFAARIKPEPPYIVVDGACENNPGVGEYRGCLIEKIDGIIKVTQIFKLGPFQNSTNNLMEFLALVHGLAHCKKQGLDLKVYSDSNTAIAWVKKGSTNSNVAWDHSNRQLKDLCIRGIQWLLENRQRNQVVKWETKYWGENPADFGNKR